MSVQQWSSTLSGRSLSWPGLSDASCLFIVRSSCLLARLADSLQLVTGVFSSVLPRPPATDHLDVTRYRVPGLNLRYHTRTSQVTELISTRRIYSSRLHRNEGSPLPPCSFCVLTYHICCRNRPAGSLWSPPSYQEQKESNLPNTSCHDVGLTTWTPCA